MKVTVVVADKDYSAGDEVRTYWEGTGGWYHAVRNALGTDMAFSVILSRMARELRREVGIEGAGAVLRQFAETMDEAAEADIE